MIPKIIIETKINPETYHYEYRAKLDANYHLSVNSWVISTECDLQSMIETELKMGLSNAVYGNIVKEMRQVIEVYSELKSIKTKEYSDFDLLGVQIKKLEDCTNNIMNLCFFEQVYFLQCSKTTYSVFKEV